MWAVIPVKDLSTSKERLSSVLDADQRQALSKHMLRDVLKALSGADLVSRIFLVTNDPVAIDIAQEMGAEILPDPGKGLSAAVKAAGQHLRQSGANGMLFLPADVPSVTSNEIDDLIRSHAAPPSATIVQATTDGGTNAILVSPPDKMDFHFGKGSFEKHVKAAKKVGLLTEIRRVAGLSQDVDRPQDLEDLIHLTPTCAAGEYLRSINPG